MTRQAKRSRSAAIDVATMRRVKTLVGEGSAGKAFQTLDATGLHCLSDPLVWVRLLALHPQRDEDLSKHPESMPTGISLDLPEGDSWDDRVCRAIQSFPRSSAGGPSGLRPSQGNGGDRYRRSPACTGTVRRFSGGVCGQVANGVKAHGGL